MNLRIRLLTSMVFIFSAFAAWSQTSQITGKVTDEAGVGLPGATVVIKGTTIGTATDLDGNYSLKAADGDVLVVSFTGMQGATITVGPNANYNTTLSQGVDLNEVVVTAIGIERETRSLGYAVQEIGGDAVTQARETNVVSAMAGKVAGVVVNNSSGAAGSSSRITIRGNNTIRGDNQPLFVVDGIPIDNSQLSSGNPNDGRNGFLSSVMNSNRAIDIPQEDIETMTVLRGAAATALYGSQAGNGAIVITTKSGTGGGASRGMNVTVNTGFEFTQYNKMVPLQDQWSQGLFGGVAGPESGSGYSWGALIDTLEYSRDQALYEQLYGANSNAFDADGNYLHDPNGFLVPQGEGNGQAANSYENIDNFFKNGFKQNYSVALSGGNELADYYFSSGYLNEEGIIPNNSFTKYNVGFNGGINLSEKLRVSSSVKYINSGGVRIEQGSNVSGVMLGLTRTSPTFDNSRGFGEDAADNLVAYTFADGSQRKYRYRTATGFDTGYDNPFWTVNNNPLQDEVNRVIGKFEIDYKFTSNFRAKYRIGLDTYSDYRSQYFAIGSRQFTSGQVTENTFNVNRFNEDIMLFYDTDLSEKLALNVTIGHNRRSFKNEQVYVQGDGLTIPGFYDVSNASGIISVNDDQRSRDQALYGMAELALDNYLYLTLTGRSEWTTTLPKDNNPFFYPSATLGFVFTDAFDTNIDWFDFGKLRLGYAKVGLGSPFLYATRTYFASGGTADGWVSNGLAFPFDGVNSFEQQATLGDSQLGPEENTEIEVGLDLKFLKNRLGVDVTYYSKESNDLIFPVPIAPSTGYELLLTNSGSMTNKGVEIALYATPVQTETGFQWDINANWTKNVNEVTELAEGVENVTIGGFQGSSIRAVEGEPYGSIFGFGFYRDANGEKVIGSDGFPILDPEEKSFGSAQPDWVAGFRNTFSYKGFSLSALIDIREGGQMWNGTKGALFFWGTHQETDVRGSSTVFEGNFATYDEETNELILDNNGVPVTSSTTTIMEDGEEVEVSEIEVVLDENWLAFGNGNGFFGDNTEDFIEDMSWVRLRDVSLTYDFPAKTFENNFLTGASITLTGRNLWLDTDYSGVDPETSLAGSRNEQGMDYFNMPNTKGYAIALRVNF